MFNTTFSAHLHPMKMEAPAAEETSIQVETLIIGAGPVGCLSL